MDTQSKRELTIAEVFEVIEIISKKTGVGPLDVAKVLSAVNPAWDEVRAAGDVRAASERMGKPANERHM